MTAVADVLAESVGGGLLELTLDRPEAMNSLNLALKDRLAETLHRVRYDDNVRAVLITGAGRAFCAGGDLSEMDPTRTPEQARTRQHKLLSDVIVALAKLPKPTVAAVNGHAHGAGLSLALACDIVIAAEDAPMSLGYVRRGLSADCGITHFLPRLVGMAKAKELLFTGRRFTGAEASQMGLIARVAAADELLTVARETAASLASSATVALAQTKLLLETAPYRGLDDLIEFEAYTQAITRSTRDHAEGVAAFTERRDPVFTGA